MAIFNSYVSLPEGTWQGFLMLLVCCSLSLSHVHGDLHHRGHWTDAGYGRARERHHGPGWLLCWARVQCLFLDMAWHIAMEIRVLQAVLHEVMMISWALIIIYMYTKLQISAHVLVICVGLVGFNSRLCAFTVLCQLLSYFGGNCPGRARGRICCGEDVQAILEY